METLPDMLVEIIESRMIDIEHIPSTPGAQSKCEGKPDVQIRFSPPNHKLYFHGKRRKEQLASSFRKKILQSRATESLHASDMDMTHKMACQTERVPLLSLN